MTDFAGLIRTLADGGVECILIGGVAATIHGLARPAMRRLRRMRTASGTPVPLAIGPADYCAGSLPSAMPSATWVSTLTSSTLRPSISTM